MVPCKTHPMAPHSFLRNASHSEGRYVCQCEFWEPPTIGEYLRPLLINEAWGDPSSIPDASLLDEWVKQYKDDYENSSNS